MKKEKYGVGAIFKTTEGCDIEIIEKLKGIYRVVEFKDKMKHKVKTNCSAIRRGSISNPYHPSFCGIGYFGVGEFEASINGVKTKEYHVWSGMLRRCYDTAIIFKNPTYENCTVCVEWCNFQTFAKWYNNNYPNIYGIKFHLDKDLLQQYDRNKIYSPETCVFLPQGINVFLANKKSYNTSGYIGASWHKSNKKWTSSICLFGEGKPKHLGHFTTPELASISYQQARVIESEKAKQYLRDLNYLPENIIQLVR